MIAARPMTAPMSSGSNAPRAPAELPNKNGISIKRYFVISLRSF